MRVIYHPEAETELFEAARFYAERIPRLGSDFLDAIDDGIATIVSDPDRLPIVEHDIRRYTLRRFPYSIYFRVEADTPGFCRQAP